MTTTAIILDVLTAAALIAFTVMGAHRGFFRTVAGLLAVILALVGAQLFTNWAAPHVSGVLQPAIERRVEKKVDAALGGDTITPQEPQIGASRPDSETQDQKEAEESEIQRLLRAISVDEQLFQRLGESAREKVRDTGVTVATAVVQSVAESVIRALLFLLSFAVFLLKLLAKLLDLALKLPVLRSMNGLAGAAVGLVEGALAVFLAVWLLRRFGVSFETPAVEGTYLLSFFAKHTPLSALASVGTRG